MPLTRNSLNILKSEYINIIQHPRGRHKEVVVQDNRVVRADNLVVHYSCDTEPGSSGSPVFNNQWKLVALHHASVQTDDPEGRHSRDGNSRTRYLNEGVRLSAIAAWLETTEADHPEQSRAIERLRGIFEGIDPQIGFFGALGRRSRSQSAAKDVVEIYRGGCGDLDIAYWNLEGFASDDLEQLGEFARAVAELNMDVWCLENISVAATALRHRLQTSFRLDYAIIRDGSPGRPSILQRRRTGLVIDGRDPPAIRATTALGVMFEFDLETLRDAARRDSLEDVSKQSGAGRLIVGSASDWRDVEPAKIAASSAEAEFDPLVFGSPIDGAIAIVPNRRGKIEQVSPRLTSRFGAVPAIVWSSPTIEIFPKDSSFKVRLDRSRFG